MKIELNIKRVLSVFWIVFSLLYFYRLGFLTPQYNFDRLFYSAAVLKLDGDSDKEIHNKVLVQLKKKLSVTDFNNKFNDSYRLKMKDDYNAFVQQLPLYTTKPLYIFFHFLVFKFNKDIFSSGVILNFVFYVLLYFLFFFILKKYTDYFIAITISTILFCNSFAIGIMRIGTPDILSAFFTLLFVYQLYFKKKINSLFSSITILLMILSRNDNIILAILFIIFLFIYKIILKKQLYLFLLIALVSYSFSNLIFNNYYGWYTTFYHTFIEQLEYPQLFKETINIKLVLKVIFENALFFNESNFVIASLLIISLQITFGKTKLINRFALLIFVIIFIRFLTFPVTWDRFNFIFVLLLLINFFKGFKNQFPIKENSRYEE